MYKVLVDFCDGERGRAFPYSQGGYEYQAGDAYPKNGYIPTAEHLVYLLCDKNKFGHPVIEIFEDEQSEKLTCPHCGKEYATQATLAAHIKKEHPESNDEAETDGEQS